MRWGLLGYGRIARKFEESLSHSDQKIVAIASRSGHASINSSARIYSSYDLLYEDPHIDIIYVSTTHNTHAEYSIRALNAGKHVLCEKPMSTSFDQVSQMIAAAHRNKRFLMEGIWSRYLPAYRESMRFIEEGVIGEVQFINAHFGFQMNPDDPKERLIKPELAAGAIWDVGIYPISLAQDIFKESPEKMMVSANLTTLGIEDRCAMQFSYSKGRKAQLSCAIDLNTTNHAVITGTKGNLVMNDFWKCQKFFINTEEGSKAYYMPMMSTGLYHEAVGCAIHIAEGLIESPLMSWDHSLQLSKILDKTIGLARSS